MEHALCEIAGAVGTPLIIDNATTKQHFGHYDRVLVDLDISRKIFHEVMVEGEGYAFNVEVIYEWMPDFCSYCKSIGHGVNNFRSLHPQKQTKTVKEGATIDKGKKILHSQKQVTIQWVAVENPSGIDSSIAFAAT